MPRTITLVNLRTIIQDEADIRDPPFTNAMLLRWINIARAKFYGLIAQADPDRFYTEETITVVSGTAAYALAATHLFTHLAAVLKTDGKYKLMERYQLNEMFDGQYGDTADRELARYREMGGYLRIVPTPAWSGSIKHCYIPVLTDLSGDSDTTDCISGWEEYIVADVCARCRAREEGDAREFLSRRSQVEAMIASIGNRRNVSTPDKITDVRRRTE